MNFTHEHEAKYPMWWVVVSGTVLVFVALLCRLVFRRDAFDVFGDRDDET